MIDYISIWVVFFKICFEIVLLFSQAVLSSLQSPCLSLQSVGIIDLYHHTHHNFYLNKFKKNFLFYCTSKYLSLVHLTRLPETRSVKHKAVFFTVVEVGKFMNRVPEDLLLPDLSMVTSPYDLTWVRKKVNILYLLIHASQQHHAVGPVITPIFPHEESEVQVGETMRLQPSLDKWAGSSPCVST